MTVGGLPSSWKRSVAVVPFASATPRTVRSMRALISARTAGSCVRTVPSITTLSAMMLKRVPPWMRPIVSTRGWRPSIWRETIVCSACTSSAATGTGSRPFQGSAPWTVLPATSIENESLEAKIGPSAQPTCPASNQPPTWRPKTRVDLRLVEGALPAP